MRVLFGVSLSRRAMMGASGVLEMFCFALHSDYVNVIHM